MKIRTKLPLALLTLVLTMGAVGYVSLAWLEEASLKTAGVTIDDVVVAKRSFLLGSAVVALLAGLGGFVLAKSISAPIDELTRTAAEVAGTGIDKETHGRRTDEVTGLAYAFDRMTKTLRASGEELRKEKETLDKIISLNPYSIAIFDKDGHILRWNPAFIELCKEPPPKEYSLFEDPLIKQHGQQESLLGLKQGKVHEMPEMWYNTSHIDPKYPDNPVCLRTVSFPIMDDAGQLQWIVVLGEDITQRKRAEESLLKEQKSLRHLLDASDRERQLIAYEIHDGVAQQLIAAKMQLEICGHLQHADSQSAREAHDQAVAMLDEAVAEIRRLISGLRPPIIDEMGIVSAIEHLASDVRAREGVSVEFVPNVKFDRLSPPLENALFRVAQESLTNACRHSQSDRVRIELAQQNGEVRIEVQDWGIGFLRTEVSDACFGIQGIRQRARLFGGEATIDSTPGEGTRVVVRLPVVHSR